MKVTLKGIARWLLPKAAKIRVYRQLAIRYLQSIPPPPRNGKPVVVVFNHFFDQDIRALQYCQETAHFVVIDAPRLFSGAKLFFGAEVQRLLAPYESEPSDNRAAYKVECTILLDIIQSRFDPAVIVLTADNFYWAREIVALAKLRGIKVVVVDKEGVITPHYFEAGAERYKNLAPFISDRIFVYSERQSEYWQRAGVPADRVSVIGQLRSDLFYREHSLAVDDLFACSRPLITLFSYEDDAYITMLQNGNRKTWKQMKTETHDAVYEMAKSNRGYNFVMKTHPQQSDLHDLQARYGGLPNLVIVGGSATGNELIQRSELIIAFQSTAVIEAMFMARRVIYTAWDTNYDHFASNILPFHDAPGIQIARSLGTFELLCRRFLAGDRSDFDWTQEERNRRDAFVERYLYRPDGHVCERFTRLLGEVIS